ncbi:MAG: SDR family NAD(P)-dependent oxidoreductase [Capsulimonadaceae bacterium]|nr:SDR family NAD(P)-dependent oxidoreductase [Capsulimonadaceae bacterium]
MNSTPLDKKTAFITGAARGIGYAIAHRFAEEGANVVLTDVNDELNEQSAERINKEFGQRALALHCDVANRSSVDAAIARTIDEFGGLNIVVCNAGICPFVNFLELDNTTWQRTIDVILTGSFNVSQAGARAMIAKGVTQGRIIFITSGSTIQASGTQVDYAAAKSGVRMMMASMSTMLPKLGITANAISPGVVHTEMGAFHWDVPEHRAEFARTNPVPRLASPADIANAAVFLASDASEYINGASIRVDGGLMPIG